MQSPDPTITGTYDYDLIILSVFIAVLASYAALDLAGRVTFARGRARVLWLIGGAIAMGLGIWSMHYVGMLALRLSVPVAYHWPTVLLSMLVAILASALALFIASRQRMGATRAVFGSALMGGGIAAMHYIGMAAMRLPAMCHFSSALVALSVIFAIAMSFLALCTTYHFRTEVSGEGWKKVAGALVLGAAIPVMHYTGMAAASFTASAMPAEALAKTVSISSLGIAAITIITLLVLGFVFLTSIFDRRAAAQAEELHSSEQRYRRIVETAFDAFVGLDPEGLITDWNTQAEVLFGWLRADALGQRFDRMIISGVDWVDKNGYLQSILSSDQSSSPEGRIELTALHRDGRKFPVEMTIATVDFGGTYLVASFVRDVTQRKRTEQERETAKQAAEAASRAKGEFLANMSHEIRTPLNGIVGMTDLTLETSLTQEQREYVETVKLSADLLLVVINDILDFSKIEAGRVDLEELDFDLRDCIESTMKTVAFRADEKGIELLCEIAPEVPEDVKGDPGRLRQIVINLLGNAIKFTDRGEVSLKVETEETSAVGHLLHFTVSDTGIGIAPEKQKLIFAPFSQADNSTTRKYGGTGLGLTISSRLVEIMRGKIWVESDVGAGSRFHFNARFGVSDAKVVAPSAAASSDVLRGIKVLVVDDSRTNRQILERLLTLWQMRPTAVESGEAAVGELSSAREAGDPYTLILTDMHMPNMDGFALIEEIRAKQELSAATIMMLTSAGHRGDANQCKQLGVAGYLLKPVRQSELREAITMALGTKDHEGINPLITRYSLRDSLEPRLSLRVLLAEDNEVNQKLAQRLLEKRGHRVTVTNNGFQAVETLEKQPFDLVLMDMQMPEMDGLEATAAIREKEKFSGLHTPIIALTAHAMKGDKERCVAGGMDGYLAKPIRPQELDELLAKYTSRRAAAIPTAEIAETK